MIELLMHCECCMCVCVCVCVLHVSVVVVHVSVILLYETMPHSTKPRSAFRLQDAKHHLASTHLPHPQSPPLQNTYRFHQDQLLCTNEPPVPDSRDGMEAVHYLLEPSLLRPLWYIIPHLMVGMCLLMWGRGKKE